MRKLVPLLAGIVSVCMVLPAFGEIYRCIDEKGKSTISNAPCSQGSTEAFSELAPTGEQTRKVNNEAPKEQLQTEGKRPYGQPSDDLIASCMNKYRDMLKDPRSPYVYKVAIAQRKLYLDVRAKNSFGGYVPNTFVCPLLSNNAIDEKALESYLTAFQFGIPLKNW